MALALALALAAAVAGFVAACIRPDVVPPAPYVEQVVQSSFAIHPLTGLAVVAGLITMLVPAAGATDTFLIFGATWLAIIVAAILGNYPTPLVGYGSSAILGYCLSASQLRRTS